MENKTLFRFRYKIQGGHTHVGVFAGPGKLSLGKCGDLVFRNEEWNDFLSELYPMPPGGSIEILPEDGVTGNGNATKEADRGTE
jgi:hypothetical protein